MRARRWHSAGRALRGARSSTRESSRRRSRELRALPAPGHDVLVLQVRDPEEAALSLEAAHRFRDPETLEDRLADPRAATDGYARRALAFEREARDMGRVGRIDHAVAAT